MEKAAKRRGWNGFRAGKRRYGKAYDETTKHCPGENSGDQATVHGLERDGYSIPNVDSTTSDA